jgi:hypothetical protein
MKPSRIRTLLIGLGAGVAYAFLVMLVMMAVHRNVSIAYIFILPLILGAIPVLFSTKEQLRSYGKYLLLPWVTAMTFLIIVAPFLVLGSLGAFIFRLIRLRDRGNSTPLYASLLLPFLVLAIETGFQPADHFYTVRTSIDISGDRPAVWENIKNVRNIHPDEMSTHFVHLIGVPKPLDGRLDREGIGGVRYITWGKGIRFREEIRRWEEGKGFGYDIQVDPASIPPSTLDEHVMIGGRYFDVISGSYRIDSLGPGKSRITLRCTYRVTTSLNFYSRWWADFMLDDFQEMILEVVKKRSEQSGRPGRIPFSI